MFLRYLVKLLVYTLVLNVPELEGELPTRAANISSILSPPRINGIHMSHMC